MLGPIVRQLQTSLERKAASVQREFLDLSNELTALSKEMMKLTGEEHKDALKKQSELRERQQIIAERINFWRDFARKAVVQGTEERMRAFLEEIQGEADEELLKELDDVHYLLDNPDEILKRLEAANRKEETGTPVGRLIERARSVFDMRKDDITARREAAFEFANRPGMMQEEEVLSDLEKFMQDEDQFVRETVLLTKIQLHRLRAVRLANIAEAHKSVKQLIQINHPAVISILIEILENPRQGYMDKDGEMVEVSNDRSRQIALLRLVEWHTPEAKKSIYLRRFDPNKGIVSLVEKTLELFPDEWDGTMDKKSLTD